MRRAAASSFLVAALLLWLAPLSAARPAAPLNAHDIMEKNFFASKVKSLRAQSTMVLINEQGQRRERKSLNIVKLQPNAVDSKFLVRFSYPNDIKGTGFLQIEHIDGEDDQWIYLPALKKSRRLVANNKKDSFVGSDFSYGDISLPRVEAWKHTLLRSESLDAHPCYVIESVPGEETIRSNSGYSKKITWVSQESFIESKVEYYDLAGRLLKTQTTAHHELIEPEPQRWFALSREMINHQSGHRTVLSFEALEPGVEISDDLFTTRYVERE